MGWENYHLHEFTVHGKHYGNPEFEEDPKRKFYDEQAIKLKEVVAGKPGTRLRYLYDFGDCWFHDLLVEGVLLADPLIAYPRCEAGERRCPPEDVGGISGYQHYLEALADPEDEEHQDMLDWRGRSIRKSSLLRMWTPNYGSGSGLGLRNRRLLPCPLRPPKSLRKLSRASCS